MKKLVYIVPLLLLLSVKGCVDPIPFEVEQESPTLVIFGTVTQEERDHYVRISRTNSFGRQPLPVEGASVYLIDDLGNEAVYFEVNPGEYLIPEGFLNLIVGRSYFLEVILANGIVIRSRPEILRPPVAVESTYFTVDYREELTASRVILEEAFVTVRVNTQLQQDNENQPYLRWETDEAYNFIDLKCHPLDSFNECFFYLAPSQGSPVIFHSEDPNQERLENFPVFARRPFPTIQFNFRHYFTVRQYTISREAHEYWDRVNNVANPTGSIFDIPPASIPGNLYDVNNPGREVLGYFEVAGVSVGRTYTQPETLDPLIILPECYQFIPQYNDPEICCNCANAGTNLISRPDYW